MKANWGTRLVVAMVVVVSAPVSAQTLIWSEDFTDEFGQAWSTTPGLPASHVNADTVAYVGGPGVVFQMVDEANVLRLNHILTDLQRVGLSANATFDLDEGYVELRLNTLVQDLDRIDGLIELWLMDADDNSQFVRICLFGAGLSDFRMFQWESSIDGYFETPFDYANNTWYRLRIHFGDGPMRLESHPMTASRSCKALS